LVTSEPVIDEPINPTNTDPEPLGTIDGTDPNPVVVTGGVSASVASAGAGLATLSAPVDFAEVMPQFEGGLKAMAKFVQKRMKYPNSARHIGMEGIVFVRFVVNVDGTVTDVEVVRGIYKDCDREAARVIALMPAWKPGMQNHSPVAVRMVLPIKFKLTE
jgi:protein TonB